jgi:hypothetical protein
MPIKIMIGGDRPSLRHDAGPQILGIGKVVAFGELANGREGANFAFRAPSRAERIYNPIGDLADPLFSPPGGTSSEDVARSAGFPE